MLVYAYIVGHTHVCTRHTQTQLCCANMAQHKHYNSQDSDVSIEFEQNNQTKRIDTLGQVQELSVLLHGVVCILTSDFICIYIKYKLRKMLCITCPTEKYMLI